MKKSRLALDFAASAAVGALITAGLTASAATPNDTACRKPITGSWNSEKVVLYNACRFDKLDAAVAALTPTPTPSPSASPTPTVTPKSSATPTPTVTPTPTATPTPTSSPTAKPIVEFNGAGSAGLAQYGQGNYDASAELWGVNGYNYVQDMKVYTHDVWSVDVKTDNTKGDGAVKAYPSMRRIYHDWSTSDFTKDPLVSSFPQLKVDFGSTDPASCSGCIYDTAFDIWLNGIGNGNANELMIWTHNVAQTPFGTKVKSGIQLDGHTWDLYTGNSNHYIAYVPTDVNNIPSGTMDVKAFANDLISRGILKSDSRMGQVSYGVETVSTNAVTKHWDFNKFTVIDN